MKFALGCLGVVVVIAVGFFALVSFVLVNSDEDQSALTSETEARVIRAEAKSVRGTGSQRDRVIDIVYRYDVAGQTFEGESTLDESEASDSIRVVTLCVDPAAPAMHVISVRGVPCGGESVRFGRIDEAVRVR